jgi:hypothetical protein
MKIVALLLGRLSAAFQFQYTWRGYEVPGVILLCDLIGVKICLCMFQLAPLTILAH